MKLGILYRSQQFWTAWFAAPSAQDLEQAREVLSPELMDLFLRMQPSEQSHSLAVFNALQTRGEDSHDLLAAALLHDVGKSRYPLTLWDRSLVVIFQKIAPVLVKKWGESNPNGWKKAFVVYARHAKWGADLVESAGGSELVVRLIKRHQDPIAKSRQTMSNPVENRVSYENSLLLRLQAVDNES